MLGVRKLGDRELRADGEENDGVETDGLRLTDEGAREIDGPAPL